MSLITLIVRLSEFLKCKLLFTYELRESKDPLNTESNAASTGKKYHSTISLQNIDTISSLL